MRKSCSFTRNTLSYMQLWSSQMYHEKFTALWAPIELIYALFWFTCATCFLSHAGQELAYAFVGSSLMTTKLMLHYRSSFMQQKGGQVHYELMINMYVSSCMLHFSSCSIHEPLDDWSFCNMLHYSCNTRIYLCKAKQNIYSKSISLLQTLRSVKWLADWSQLVRSQMQQVSSLVLHLTSCTSKWGH